MGTRLERAVEARCDLRLRWYRWLPVGRTDLCIGKAASVKLIILTALDAGSRCVQVTGEECGGNEHGTLTACTANGVTLLYRELARHLQSLALTSISDVQIVPVSSRSPPAGSLAKDHHRYSKRVEEERQHTDGDVRGYGG